MTLREAHGQHYPEGVDYRQATDDRACVPASIAYLLFRIGAPRELWTPDAVDVHLGRRPGEPAHNLQSGVLLLADNGARITEISSYDKDRFIRGGLEYLVEYVSTSESAGGDLFRENPRSFFELWTPQRVEAQQEYERDLLDKVKLLGDDWTWVHKKPDLQDVVRGAEQDSFVVARMQSSVPSLFHTRVALERLTSDDGVPSGFVVFDNDYVPPITEWTDSGFSSRLLVDDGLTIVSVDS